jgi:hypothetical protein
LPAAQRRWGSSQRRAVISSRRPRVPGLGESHPDRDGVTESGRGRWCCDRHDAAQGRGGATRTDGPRPSTLTPAGTAFAFGQPRTRGASSPRRHVPATSPSVPRIPSRRSSTYSCARRPLRWSRIERTSFFVKHGPTQDRARRATLTQTLTVDTGDLASHPLEHFEPPSGDRGRKSRRYD